jgi:hypothetical protein
MRPGQGKRSRGRNGGGNPHHNNNNNNRPRLPQRIQTFDSNGPAVKIRGNAYQVFERYVAMAREAVVSGDRVAAENLYQHAEHYYRVMNLAGGEGHNQGQQRPMTPADTEMAAGGDGESRGSEDGQEAPAHFQHQPEPPQSPIGDDQYRRELDEPMASVDRKPDPGRDEGQLPPFITGRPD